MSPVVSTGTPRSWDYSPEKETEGNFEGGRVQTLADLESLPWPDPLTVDVAHIETAAQVLPPGMGIITGVGGIFTRTWMLMGYEHFALSLADDPALVARVAAQVGQIQCAVLRRLIQMPRVVAVWYGDDLAYTEGLLVSPSVLRKYFFPWIEELSGIAHGAGMPFIMHTDGNVQAVLDDLVALGLNALHPIEPKAMDIYELKRRYGQKLALFGNIDLGYTLVAGEGTPQAVRDEVRQRIKDLAPGGGYAVASGAGATRYVVAREFHRHARGARRVRRLSHSTVIRTDATGGTMQAGLSPKENLLRVIRRADPAYVPVRRLNGLIPGMIRLHLNGNLILHDSVDRWGVRFAGGGPAGAEWEPRGPGLCRRTSACGSL